MTIGQITISAADWLAARATDRMAIAVAASKVEDVAELGGKSAVAASDEGGESQLGQDRRQRSILAAQESYRRVAARIKSRLADRAAAETARPNGAASPANDRTRLIEGLRDNSKLAASLIAGDREGTDLPPIRVDTAPSPASTGLKSVFETEGTQESPDAETRAGDREAEPADPVSTWEAAEARADAIAADAVFRKGLWADLFETVDEPTDHIPVVED